VLDGASTPWRRHSTWSTLHNIFTVCIARLSGILGAIVLRTASFSMFALYNFAARPFFGRCRKYRELGGKRECFRVRNNELSDLEGFVMSPG
jgi:hypothetical protein